MLKLWLKLHEATNKALVRLPRLAPTHTSFGPIRASQGRFQDCYRQRKYEQVRQHARASAAEPAAS